MKSFSRRMGSWIGSGVAPSRSLMVHGEVEVRAELVHL